MQQISFFLAPLKKQVILLFFLIIGNYHTSSGQEMTRDTSGNVEKEIYRDYHYMIAPNYDLYNSSINIRTTGKLLHDAFTRGIGPQIKNKTVRNISEGVWSFGTIFYTMLMGHEFGHMLRARQADGRFTIQKFSFPVIYGKMDLPADHSLEENILSVAGGFEVNYLMVKDIQMDLYKHDKLYNDELSLSFTNRLMYPVYFSLIAPVDPEKSETWINTMGDPVHWIKPIWERSGDSIVESDGSVNPDLSRFYKQAALASLLWNLADMNFYSEVAASFGDNLQGKKAKYLIGNHTTGWGYGTFFNTSVLGAELHMINYCRFKEKLYTVQVKYGFPFRNIGVGIGAYDVLAQQSKINFDVMLDVWDQAFYNEGFALTVNTNYKLGDHFDLVVQSGYKTEGYLIGRIVRPGFIGNFGLRYKR